MSRNEFIKSQRDCIDCQSRNKSYHLLHELERKCRLLAYDASLDSCISDEQLNDINHAAQLLEKTFHSLGYDMFMCSTKSHVKQDK